MKNKIFSVLFIAILFTQVLNAQSKMLVRFNKLSTKEKSGTELVFKNGKVVMADAEAAASVICDDKNGYLQIKDDGTGGGTSVQELAIFKTTASKEILVFSSYIMSADGVEAVVTSYYNYPEMTDATMQVWPDIGYIKDILPKSVTEKEIEKYKSSEFQWLVLPKTGTTVLLYTSFTALEREAASGDKKAKTLQDKLRKTPAKLIWNKTNGTFELQ